MMLRSLVKKFKSHSLNEDAPPDNQPSPPQLSEHQLIAPSIPVQNNNQGSDNVQTLASVGDRSALESLSSVNCSTIGKHDVQTDRNQPPIDQSIMSRQHHLRSSTNTCGSVSSIATRLRSSVISGQQNSMIDQQQQQQQPHRQQSQQRTSQKFCSHRRQGGNRYYYCQGSTSKTMGEFNNAVLDDDFCKDSGTESDDEELERIETNSTHSVPVSQTSDYYASQQSLSINSCRSSHCSSPLLGLSDQECNSWESIGSESGISLRATVATPGSRQHQKQHHHEQQQQKYQNYRSSNAITAANNVYRLNSQKFAGLASTPTPTMSEELPQHHYHTRQQFQRLTQQISMKNGLISESANQDIDDQDEIDNSNSSVVGQQQQPPTQPKTAFVPVRRYAASEPKPIANFEQQNLDANGGGGGSSVDELEEVNFGVQQQHGQLQKRDRRARSSTISVVVSTNLNSSGGSNSSEKRKWSQMRQEKQQKEEVNIDCCCSISSSTDKKRPVLHAARKTPIRLLFSLDGGGGGGGVDDDGAEEKSVNNLKKCQMHNNNNNRDLPQNGNVSPPVGSLAKKSRSTKKKDEADQGKGVAGAGETNHRCPKEKQQQKSSGEEDFRDDDDDEGERAAKRPSLDFNKMRGKLVGIGAAGGRNKKTKRSNNLISGQGLKAKLKSFGNCREGYQLRSTHRQCCLFRPLEPPTTITDGNEIIDNQSAAWFGSQTRHEQEHPWQQQGLPSTFFFGGANSNAE